MQTLSRLNRTYRTPSGQVKDSTVVVDFVNVPEQIQADFEPYYTDAYLETATDPNLVHDIAAKLDAAGIYEQSDVDVDAVADAWVRGQGNQVLDSAFAPTLTRFHTRRSNAVVAGDKAGLGALALFTKDLATFARVYDFMSQIVDYASADLEKRSISPACSPSACTTGRAATTSTCRACRWSPYASSTRDGPTSGWASGQDCTA